MTLILSNVRISKGWVSGCVGVTLCRRLPRPSVSIQVYQIRYTSVYDSQALPTTGGHFRVLTLQPSADRQAPLVCELTQHSLDGTVPEYTALSYAWGQQDSDKTIQCNGELCSINDNLEQALLTCRSPTRARKFWVDQICINQEDLSEKSHQIPMMREIFRRAKDVIGWLGEPDELTSDLAQYAEWVLNRPFFNGDTFPKPDQTLDFANRNDRDRGRLALIELFRNYRWFHRSWIVQEASARRENLRLTLGQHSFPYQSLLEVVFFTNYQMRMELGNVSRAFSHPLGWRAYFTALQFCPAIELANDDQGKNTLLMLVAKFSSWKASDPRDKVYSLFALANDASKYRTPDYQLTVERVYRQFALTSFFSHAANVLSSLTFAAHSEPLAGSPTWATNWATYEKLPVSAMRNNAAFSAGGALDDVQNFCVDENILVLPGAIKGVVSDHSAAYETSSGSPISFTSWLHSAASWMSDIKKRFSNGNPPTFDIGDECAKEVDPDYTRDLARILVLDGESTLYSLNGKEAQQFATIQKQLVQGRPGQGVGSRQTSRGGEVSATHARALTMDERALSQYPPSRLDRFARLGVSPATLIHTYPSTKQRIRCMPKDPSLSPSQQKSPEQKSREREERDLIEYRDLIKSVASNHKLIVLEDGALGLANWKVQRGDVVAVLVGARMPFILRPAQVKGQYTLVSEAYIRGLMFDSIATERETGETCDISIC